MSTAGAANTAGPVSTAGPAGTGITWLAVTPLDTIMVRDGRPFDAGAASSATAVPPAPNTLGGVVGAALDGNVTRILGPVVETEAGVVFAVPCDVVRDGGTVRRLAVAQRADRAVSDLDERYRLSHHLVGEGDPMNAQKWITRTGLADWLNGDLPAGQDIAEPPLLASKKSPWVAEARLGLARHWSGPLSGTAAPGLLYAMTQLRPREGTRFLVGCVTDEPVEIRDSLVPLGGRGRLAEVTRAAGNPFPARPEKFPDGRLAVYLATPALLPGALWHPPEAELVAVAVPGPQPVASASPRNGFAGSRQLLWAVPAGSVFFLKFATSAEATTWAAEHHQGLLPHQSMHVASQPGLPLVHAGFGTCLTGSWTWNDGC